VVSRVPLGGLSTLQLLDGVVPDLTHFRAFGCSAVILARAGYRIKGTFCSPGVVCVYIGTGRRRAMTGALFMLPDGCTAVSQHYTL
jgi:hypothetical protein